ncbi:hypothetical protein [Parasitella parasitica]|uniref:Uncharacterized protein n=1 Tax=Parasitella parasitica TaxID=35722 RepID=A0A0B7NEZ9_9FUNG|nr:hypothetical protein [Parasitella parasitica]
MSNPHPERKIAQPRRRLNRTASTNSVGSVGSASGNTSPMPQFGLGGSPSTFGTAAKPPVQPSFGGFGTAASTTSNTFNTQPSHTTAGFQTGFGSPATNPPATTVFGGFGSPSVTASTGSQTFGGFGANTGASPFASFGSANKSTSSNTGGFQPGFGGTSGNVFSGFGKPLQPAKNDDDNMDADEQPSAAPVFTGFGASKPQTSAAAPSPAFSFGSTEQKQAPSPFAGFSFGKPATTPATTTAISEPAPVVSPFVGSGGIGGFKQTDTKETEKSSEAATNQQPFSGFSFGTTPASSAPFGSTKAIEDKPATATSPFTMPPKASAPTTTFGNTKASEGPFGMLPSSTTASTATSTPTISFGTTTTASTTKAIEDKPVSGPSPFASISGTVFKTTPSPFGAPSKTTASPFAGFGQAADIPSATITEIHSSDEDNEEEGGEKEKEKEQSNNEESDSSKPASESASLPSASAFTFTSIKPAEESSAKDDKEAKPFTFSTPAPVITATTTATTPSSLFKFSGPTSSSSGDKSVEETSSKEDKETKAFAFSVPTSSTSTAAADKPSPFKFSGFSSSSGDKLAQETPPKDDDGKETKAFAFSTSASTTTTTADKPSPFKFSGLSGSAGDKPASLSFSAPVASSSGSGSGSSSTSTSTSSTSVKKKRDRDDDTDDSSNEQHSHKKSHTASFGAPPSTSAPSFSFGGSAAAAKGFTFGATPSKAADNKNSSASFTFGLTPSKSDNSSSVGKEAAFTFGKPAASASAEKKDTPGFTFGSTFGKTDDSTKETPAAPTFTFGKPAPASEKKTLAFGSSAKETDNDGTAEKDSSSATAPSSTPKKTFTFGIPPQTTTDSATATDSNKGKGKATEAVDTSSKPAFSFGSTSTAASTSLTGDKSGTDKGGNATVAFTTTASKTDSNTLMNGKSSLSLTGKEESLSEDTGDKANTAKKVSFNLPEASSSSSSTATASSGSTEPASVSLAFSKVKSTEDPNAPATLSILPSAKKDTSSSGISLETTLKSSITEMNQITYRTRFWELPDDARNELALLAHFITEQTDKRDKIDQELGSYFSSTLRETHINARALNDDAVILGESLEVQSKSINDLILLNKEQRLNAASASNIQQQDSKNWRIRGATENWNFFNDAISNMEERVGQLGETVTFVEEAIHGLQAPAPFSPQYIGTMLDEQRKMYMSLAGRVADIHREAERIVKKRKMTK